jgi:hypothetical protein
MEFSFHQMLWLFSDIDLVFLDNTFLTVLCIFSPFFIEFSLHYVKVRVWVQGMYAEPWASVVEEMKS